MSELVTLDIASIASGGDGVARHDGLVVFVPRTAPGDRVAAEVTTRGRLGRGVLKRVEQPARERVEPPCTHYVGDRCGGCQLQHLSLDAQHDAKRSIIADAFRRIGRREVSPPELRAGTNAWRYRRKLTLSLRRAPDGWMAGLHAFDDPEHVFALRDCLISDERLMVVWAEILRAGALLPGTARLRGSVRLLDRTESNSPASFVLEGGTAWDMHVEFLGRTPSIAALWWVPEGGPRRLLHDRRGTGGAREPAASFAQVNPEVARALESFVIDAAMAHAPATVVDAYAGAGAVAIALAARGVRVTAIELDEEASAWSAARLPAGSRAVAARVEHALGSALPADVVILNPPRAGVDAVVTSRLEAARNVRGIVYVSCDPATLARDVARLPSWRIARVTAFDMFPQTAHVETVCELVPTGAEAA